MPSNPPSPPPHSAPVWFPGRTGFALIIASLTVPWLGFAYFTLRPDARSHEAAPQPPLSAPHFPRISEEAQATYVVSGRWGRLESTQMVIEPPDEAIDFAPFPFSHMLWHFPRYTPAELDRLFDQVDLTPMEAQFIRDQSRWEISPERILVEVPKEIVRGLSTETRRVLYTALAVFAENYPQNSPASYRTDSVDAWFADSGLTEHTLSLVRPLIYRRSESLLFSDFELILGDIKTQEQRQLLARTLGRSRSQIVKLRLLPETDIEGVVEYWSTRQHRRNFEPMLKSLARQPGGATVDLVHLLPPTARSLLYTYAPPPQSDDELQRDCHWTALNFNLQEFDERYRDIDEAVKAYRKFYTPVTDAPRLGDIYLFVNSDDIMLHACVHLAGDLVFTKNGAWEGSPWVIMRLDDVLGIYPDEVPLTVRRIRLKP